MTIHFASLSQTFISSGWPIFFDAAIKSAIILSVAWVATLALSRASAAMRHLTWTLAVCGCLVLPILSGFLPGWRVIPSMTLRNATVFSVTMPAIAQTGSAPLPAALVKPQAVYVSDIKAAGDVKQMEKTAPVVNVGSAVKVSRFAAGIRKMDWKAWVIVAWAFGVVVTMLPLVISLLGLSRIRRSSALIESDAWQLLLHDCMARLGVKRRVTLLCGRRVAMPMTWGIFRPNLLLPPEADGWSDDRRRAVVMHELAHIQRGDFLTQFVVHFARSIYWFNPLIWIASRCIALESEGACDDLVLSQDTKPSEYAEHLLAVAGGLPAGFVLPLSAVAMARASRLESRLVAILDAGRNRGAMNLTGIALAAALLLFVVVPLAMVHAGDVENPKPSAVANDSNTPAKPVGSAATAPSAKSNGDDHLDLLGSVLPYDRKPLQAQDPKNPQRAPIAFSIPETMIQPVVRRWDAHQAIAVDVFDRNMKKIGHGALSGIDNQVGPNTGTLGCYAVVTPVDDALLFPNQFLNVRLFLEAGKTLESERDEAERKVIEAELDQARALSDERERALEAGLIGQGPARAAADKVKVLEAELAGDPVKAAVIEVQGQQYQLADLLKEFDAGLRTKVDIDQAKVNLALAEAKLQKLKARQRATTQPLRRWAE